MNEQIDWSKILDQQVIKEKLSIPLWILSDEFYELLRDHPKPWDSNHVPLSAYDTLDEMKQVLLQSKK